MHKLTLKKGSKEALSKHPIEKAKWLAGLRSDTYKQVTGGMCDPLIPNSACCLHVLEMEVNNRSWESGINNQLPSNMNVFREEQETLIPPSPVKFSGVLAQELKAIHTISHADVTEHLQCKRPAEWNDEFKLTFNQIADLLEYGEVEFK
jgi:hypothetical protein